MSHIPNCVVTLKPKFLKKVNALDNPVTALVYLNLEVHYCAESIQVLALPWLDLSEAEHFCAACGSKFQCFSKLS